MADDRDNRRDDDDLQELKRRRSRRDNDDDSDDKPRSRRKQRPEIKEFSVLVDFGKFLSQITYIAPEGFTEADVEDFVYDKKDEGLKTYSKAKPRDNRGGGYEDRGGRSSYGRGGRGYDRDRY